MAAGYDHESAQSENKRFHEACHDAGLSTSDEDRFSEEFHKMPNRERMSYNEIKRAASEWKSHSGGGFRRSDR